MNSLLGKQNEVKIILMSFDDDTLIPTKTDLKRFFPKSTIHIYKAHGPHRNSFTTLEQLLDARLNGVKVVSYSTYLSALTHIIKLDIDTENNEFFELIYSDSILGRLKISAESLEKITKLIEGCAYANSHINNVTSCVEKIEDTKQRLSVTGIRDSKIEKPDQAAIDSLFKGYGDEARAQMGRNIENWYLNNTWS